MFRTFVCWLFFSVGLPAAVAAQGVAGHIIRKYGMREGLSQGVVTSITQDERGFMWFATEDGLNRFDGYTFRTFTHAGIGGGTLDNYTQRVFTDDAGHIWVSSRRGLYLFDRYTERFMARPESPGTPHHDVSFIHRRSAGGLWLGWYGGGFAAYTGAGVLEPYSKRQLPDVESDFTFTLLEDRYGLLWVGSQNAGLHVFTLADGHVRQLRRDLSDKQVLPSFYVKCIVEDHSGNVWIGTTKGLVVYVRRTNRFYSFASAASPLAGKGIFSLLEDYEKRLWIGTQGEGLYQADLRMLDTDHPDRLTFHGITALDHYSISEHTIRSLYEDREHNLWIGTHGDGIYMISALAQKFQTFERRHYVKSAESHVQYYGMCHDADGNLWMGTDGKGIYVSTPAGEVLRQYRADGSKGSLTDNVVLSAYSDRARNLWFGTYANGLFLYDHARDRFIQFNHAGSDSAGHMGNQVRAVFEDSRGVLWVGASRGGLCRVDRRAGNFRNYPGGSRMDSIDVRAMAEDRDGGLWIGSFGDGLHYFDPATGRAQRFLYTSENANPLGSSIIFALALDRRGRLWIGTGGGGLGIYDPVTKSYKRYTQQHGLGNNTVYGILIDDADQVWVSTNKGISKFDVTAQRFYNYTAIDGLQEGQFNPGASWQNTEAGYMCFGGSMGLTLFYPERVTNDHVKADVMISGFQLFNRPAEIITPDRTDAVLDTVVSETKEITLQHDQSVFTFEFLALDYSYARKNQYAYMLEGLDHDWNYVGRQRTATYRYLQPGEYVFKVRATREEGVWPDDFAHIRIVILPPWWRTPYAYGAWFIILSLLVYGVVVVRRKQASLRRRLRMAKIRRKQERRLVKEKLNFFTAVSHEFRTPLTLMIGPLEEMLLQQERESAAGRKLRMVYRNAHKLLGLINRLLDYRKLETGHMDLKVRGLDIGGFIATVFATFEDLARRKSIVYRLYIPASPVVVWFDPEKLEMVLTNLLANAFKYIGQGKCINVSLYADETTVPGNVRVVISDDGVGIATEQLPYVFDWFYQGHASPAVSSGIGLALTRKLVHLHHGALTAESEPGKGSVFTVRLLLGTAHFRDDERSEDAEWQVPAASHGASGDGDGDDADHDGAYRKGLKQVLIVEDDVEIRGFLKEYLATQYRVQEACDGARGLTMAAEHHFDLIISDVMMPGMDGLTFCRELKRATRTSHIPVILLTAKTSQSYQRDGMETGADAYITKPFSPDMLALTMRNLLRSQDNLKRFYRGLFHQEGGEPRGTTAPDEAFLARIYALLKENLDNASFNVNELCEAVGMSRSLLYRKIKVLTGLSPVEYLRSLRLQEANVLLRSGSYRVFEVAFMVGFSDQKYFRQCFVKEFGEAPSALLGSRVKDDAGRVLPEE